MDLFEAIYSRRSIRIYSKREIPKEEIEKIIDSGIQAPSACDIQGWRFIVINDSKLKEEIVERGAASFIRKAPLGILVLYDNQTDNLEYLDYLQSASAAIQNMLLTAHSLGLGSCWVDHLPRKQELRNLLRIPKNYDPIAYITLGYPQREPKPRPRKKTVKEVVSYNKFDFDEPHPKINLKLKLKRLLRKIYYLLPWRRYLKPKIDEKFERKFD